MNVFYEEDGSFKVAAVMTATDSALQIETMNGKRTKIKANQVLMRFEQSLPGFMEAAQTEAETLDIVFLWACCAESEFNFTALATEYYGGQASSLQSAAIALKLHAAPIYFYRKGRGHYKAAPAETLKLALAAVERKRVQAEQMQVWVDALTQQQLPANFAGKADALIYQPDKNSLEWKAIDAAAQQTGQLPLTIMQQAGLITSSHDYHLGAFLREMFANGTDFPAFEPMPPLPDLPLAKVEVFSIDDATTNEIDDGFSLTQLENGNWHVGIHIAAPALGVQVNTGLDAIVCQRLSTVYMPGHKITMLPEVVVRPFSLDAGTIKPALSLYVEVTPDLNIVQHETRLERVQVAENLRHDTLEPFFNRTNLQKNSGHPRWQSLSFLHDFAESLEKARGKYDPERAPQIDYNFYVNDGIVQIVARERGAPIDKLVAELMIYANATWGGQLKAAGIPGIYRAQAGGKVFMTTEAAAHQGLGVAQYAWCTSPLRRAVDLVNQRQLIALLQQVPAPYAADDQQLTQIMRDFEQTYQAYSEFQTRMERYWCLQYLLQTKCTEVAASVWREQLVRIDGMFYITKVPSLPTLKVGTRVMLEIKQIDTLLMELHCKFKQVIAEVDAAVTEPNDADI